ncbi:DUF3043 domain-containing protein [Bombiscardovia coagulans]|uniref:DUF3043 domain-containing protein n=1 Tax=Bombiscardovia coagulans TaxID=686666 RepID=A0A261ETV8_9BIFI|nr:DUF3043 domain-containing protein [Bombiscardovia coagulans]OZG50086.1 hypothetical protein BOCO_0603 [Bombiscardovia coagulans]
MTWKLFKGNNSLESNDPSASSVASDSSSDKGKGKPTPKRKQAEQKNLRPLVPKDRKASRKAAKERIRAKEDEQYEAMRTGDLAHMPQAERLPWRIYIRDYVDARLGISEFTMPAILLFFVIAIASSFFSPTIYFGITILIYVYAIAVIIDLAYMWHKLKKKLIHKFGERSVARGSRSASYACMRAWQLRRWRIPKPKYAKRGHWPE